LWCKVTSCPFLVNIYNAKELSYHVMTLVEPYPISKYVNSIWITKKDIKIDFLVDGVFIFPKNINNLTIDSINKIKK